MGQCFCKHSLVNQNTKNPIINIHSISDKSNNFKKSNKQLVDKVKLHAPSRTLISVLHSELNSKQNTVTQTIDPHRLSNSQFHLTIQLPTKKVNESKLAKTQELKVQEFNQKYSPYSDNKSVAHINSWMIEQQILPQILTPNMRRIREFKNLTNKPVDKKFIYQ